jgi:antitoxin VapB
MSLSIKSDKADRLARELAGETGESLTTAIEKALEDRLLRERGRRVTPVLMDRLLEIGRHCAALPELDPRAPDRIMDYDDKGLPR